MHPICVTSSHSCCLSSPIRSSALTNASRIFSPSSAADLGRRDAGSSGVQASLKAAELLNTRPDAEVGRILGDYGDERRWRHMARKPVQARFSGGIHTTSGRVDVIWRSSFTRPGVLVSRKEKTVKMAPLRSAGFLSGEGMNLLNLDVTRSWSAQTVVSELGVRCQVAAGTAVPDESSPSLHDYLPDFKDKSLPLKLRALCFYVWTYVVAMPLFVVMAALQPFVLLLDKQRRTAQHFVNRIWALLTTICFYKTDIEGLENLPAPNEAAVYVANHQSFLDVYTLFLLGRPFKFISKTSNFMIPIIGWSMYLTGHVPLKRVDRRSQMECLKKCLELVRNGVPVLFFPEGTRSPDGTMAAFKKGAFTVATRGKVPVVPISLIGTGKLMPNGLEDTLRPGRVKIVVHPPIRGDNPDELCDQARNAIGQTLLKYGMPVA